MSAANTLRHAAALLREDSVAGFESCLADYEKPPRTWACTDCPRVDGKCSAQRGSEEREKAAQALELLAETAK